MKEKYSKVPNIITNKDLDYLKDMFEWHYIFDKVIINAINDIDDESILDMFKECHKFILEHMKKISKIVKDGLNEK